MDFKEEAKKLRQAGLTYRQIVGRLDNNVSLDWCKRNLKGVQKERVSDDCIMELIEKSTRPEGITVYEANAIIFKHNKDKQLTKDQMKNIRKKASYADDNCLFRPAWIDATQPVQSYKSMLAYADHLIDELDNVTRWYCDTYPAVNKGAVRYELMKHLFPKISGEPLTGRVMRSENIVELLAERNIQAVSIETELSLDTDDSLVTQTDYGVRDSDLSAILEISNAELDDIWK